MGAKGMGARMQSRRGMGTIIGHEETDVDGISVRITRKQVKNLRIRVDADGSVVASAPVYMSQAQIRRFVASKEDWILGQRIRVESSARLRAETADSREIEGWKAIVQAAVPILLKKWEPVMGVHASVVVYRNMKSRWGSCQPDTGRICFNTRLALYPPQCLEYVVVHELCHLLERGHGLRFKTLMDGFLPDWRQSRDLLKG